MFFIHDASLGEKVSISSKVGSLKPPHRFFQAMCFMPGTSHLLQWTWTFRVFSVYERTSKLCHDWLSFLLYSMATIDPTERGLLVREVFDNHHRNKYPSLPETRLNFRYLFATQPGWVHSSFAVMEVDGARYSSLYESR